MMRHFVSIFRANVSKTGNSYPDNVSSSDIYECGNIVWSSGIVNQIVITPRFDMIVRLVFHIEITDWTSKSRALHNYYAYKSHQDHPSRTISVDTYKSSPLVNKNVLIRTFGLLNSASNSSCSLLRSVSVPFRRFELIIQEKNCISKLMNKIIHLLLFDGRIN